MNDCANHYGKVREAGKVAMDCHCSLKMLKRTIESLYVIVPVSEPNLTMPLKLKDRPLA
jgi:hypothetical protein